MTKKVMLVDDDKELLEELADSMIAGGYEVTACYDGETALATAAKIMPDVILLDLKLGKVNGFQVAAKLRQSEATSFIPVIAITGYYNPDDYYTLMKICGVKKCLTKPVSPENIMQEVKNVLLTN
jgi:CheY-like chemotaxis protein